jgi:nitrogen PTS system EIIA component
MIDLLTPQRVLPRLRVRDKAAALRELAAQISRDAHVPVGAILNEVQFTRVPPLTPRTGVALLHTLVSEMEHPMAAFARLELPLNIDAPDGHPTDIAVLLVSPSGHPKDHLRALACIARRLRRQDVRDLIRGTDNLDAMFIVLTSNEWSANEPQGNPPSLASTS